MDFNAYATQFKDHYKKGNVRNWAISLGCIIFDQVILRNSKKGDKTEFFKSVLRPDFESMKVY